MGRQWAPSLQHFVRQKRCDKKCFVFSRQPRNAKQLNWIPFQMIAKKWNSLLYKWSPDDEQNVYKINESDFNSIQNERENIVLFPSPLRDSERPSKMKNGRYASIHAYPINRMLRALQMIYKIVIVIGLDRTHLKCKTSEVTERIVIFWLTLRIIMTIN